MADATVELLQFPLSHFNEKARWALDAKRVPHRRTNLLPGPHMLAIRRLTGQTQVPVLRLGDEIVAGSARIIETLEQLHPDPPLYPEDPERRRRALEIQTRFDAEVGPKVRCALFSILLREPGYVCRMFSPDRSAMQRAFYRAGFPVVRTAMAKSMGADDAAAVEAAFEGTRAALDFVAKRSGSSGYLVGDSFSVADLTAAALLAPAANPPASPMARPEPVPASVRAWNEQWADHPGVAWVLERYRRDRPPSAEVR